MSMETDRIEADLNASRHRLNDTLEQLGHKLSPGQMLDEGLGLLQGQAGQFASKLGRQVRDNPMPTLLVAAGVAWLIMANNRNERPAETEDWRHDWRHDNNYRAVEDARWSVQRMANETEEAFNERLHSAYAKALDLKQMAGEAADAFKTRVSGAVDQLKHAAAGARERMGQTLSGAKHFAEHQAQRVAQTASDVKHKAQDFYVETPLAAGALALAVGALIGGAAPLSRPERETLRGVADQANRAGAKLADKAAQAGADLAERGARAVDESLDRALH